MSFKRALTNGVSNVLGSKTALPITTMLAKVGLRGLGVNVHFDFEQSGEAWLMRRVFDQMPHPFCLDVGANIGDFTLTARTMGASAVVAFEPTPATFAMLQAAVENDPDVTLIQSAVGEMVGMTTFFVPKEKTDSVLASRDVAITDVNPELAEAIMVPITSIDACEATRGRAFDYMKIDVEGYELEVLEGARHTIERHPPAIIQFEFNSHHAHRRQTMLDFALALPGYRIFRLAASSLRPLDTSHYLSTIYTFQNVVCLREGSDLLRALQ